MKVFLLYRFSETIDFRSAHPNRKVGEPGAMSDQEWQGMKDSKVGGGLSPRALPLIRRGNYFKFSHANRSDVFSNTQRFLQNT